LFQPTETLDTFLTYKNPSYLGFGVVPRTIDLEHIEVDPNIPTETTKLEPEMVSTHANLDQLLGEEEGEDNYHDDYERY